ncbi:hypothetical protein MKX34_10120 [Paenibacillus sp. FSL R5-0636]|uniref:hypothetical protein n=1 Tax=Paenibacillus TaxID=44249 RepID=UPI0015C3CC80|nr:hypothetical protein [Paenibacillus odorifer]
MVRPAELRIDILNMEQVKETIEILHDVVKDERIPESVRNEYIGRFDAIVWEVATD